MNSNALLSPQTRNPVGNIFACIIIAVCGKTDRYPPATGSSADVSLFNIKYNIILYKCTFVCRLDIITFAALSVYNMY